MVDYTSIAQILRINGLTEKSSLEEIQHILVALKYSSEDINQSLGLLKSRGWLTGVSATPIVNTIPAQAVPTSSVMNVMPVVPQSSMNNAISPVFTKPRKSSPLVTIALVVFILFVGAVVAFAYFKKVGPFKITSTKILLENSQGASSTNTLDSNSALGQIGGVVTSTPTTTSKVSTNLITPNAGDVNASELLEGGSASVKIAPNSKMVQNILMSPGSNLLFVAGWKGDGLSLTLTNPQGKVVDLTANKPVDVSSKGPSGSANPIFMSNKGEFSLMYTLDGNVPAGVWKLTESNSGSKTIDFGVESSGSSNIIVVPNQTENGMSVIKVGFGQSAYISADVAENTSGKPLGSSKITPAYLLNLNVTATIINTTDPKPVIVKTIPMTNVSKMNGLVVTDGTSPLDKNAYMSGSISGLAPGEYSVLYTIKGKDSEGQDIAEQSFGINSGQHIYVSTGDASILKLDDNGIDTVGKGLTTVINLGFWLEVQKQGVYNISAKVVFPNGKVVAVATGNFSGVVGASRPNVLLDSTEQGGLMTSGVYKVKDIEVFEMVNDEIRWVDTYQGDNGDGIYTTKDYSIK